MIALLFLAIVGADPRFTPGALCTASSVGFDGARYGAPHCRRHVTVTMRRTVLARYGVPWARRGLYELDHLIPLCMGGSNDLANLFPQSWESAKRKDVVEDRLCRLLRTGKITQSAAVDQMLGWQ